MIEHFRVELKELVSLQVQSFQSAQTSDRLEDNSWAADCGHRREQVARKIQVLQVFEVEQVIWQLLQIIGSQVELLQISALIQVSDALVADFVVGKVQAL